MNPTRNRIVLTVLLAGLSLLVTSANAANSNTLKVSATITGTCNFNSANNAAGNAELAFGTLDQTSTAAASAPAVAVNYWCTNGTAVSTFTAGNGLYSAVCPGGATRCMKNTASPDYINYTLTFTNPSGNVGSGKTTLLSVTFNATIANADYIDVPAGDYEDFVTLNINP